MAQNTVGSLLPISILCYSTSHYKFNKQGNIKTTEYEQMVLDIIQNCLASIDDSDKINFVVNGILDSDFMSFLNDRMLKKLRGPIIESVSNKI